MTDLTKSKALTFDLFGTVLDLGCSLTPFIRPISFGIEARKTTSKLPRFGPNCDIDNESSSIRTPCWNSVTRAIWKRLKKRSYTSRN